MLEAALTFGAAFVLFCSGVAPSVTFGDAGEFAAAAATLGLPHAPDYPFYTVAARGFATLVPLGNWAYRTNLFSAACGAAALSLLGAALRRWGCSPIARGAALVTLGLCPLWRYESGVTEVFGLHLLSCAALIWLAARFGRGLWSARGAAATGLVLGLGAGNHHTLALTAPALLAQGWPPGGARRAARAAGFLMAFAALGFGIYAYLPLRATKNPPLDWDHPASLPGFTRALLRRDYGSLSLTVEGRGSSAAQAAPQRVFFQLRRWLKATAGEPGWVMLGLALLGAALWSGSPEARAFLVLWTLCLGPGFLWLGDPPFDAQTTAALERFYLASWLGLVALAAGGVDALGRRGRGLDWLAATAMLALPTGSWAWAAGSARRDFGAYDYGRAVQNSLPRGAALFMDGGDDTFYSTAYLSFAQRRREDIELHDRGGVVFPSAYGADFRSVPASFKEPVREAVEAPLAQEGSLFYSTLNPKLLPRYPLKAWGLLRRPVPPTLRIDFPDFWASYPERFDEQLLAARHRDRSLAAFYPYQRAAAAADPDVALSWLALAWARAPDAPWVAPDIGYQAGLLGYDAAHAGRWDIARRAYTLWAECLPEQAEPLLDLGVVAEKIGKPGEAETLYRRALALEPGSAKPRYNLGSLYWTQGRWALAAENLEAAQRLAPGDAALARFTGEARRRAARGAP